MENLLKNNIYEPQEDRFDFEALFQKLLRSKRLILSISSVITFSTFIISSIVKPSFKGSFQIVAVQAKNKNNLLISDALEGNSILAGIIPNSSTNQKTQELILRSSSILNPIYNFAKQNYINRGEKKEFLTYNRWLSNFVTINFEKGTNVINFSFIDKDKSLILEVLNLTVKEYENYSKSDRIKKLKSGISYLEKQEKKLKINANNSLNKLNAFTIDNRLGNFELTSISNIEKNFEDSFDKSKKNPIIKNKTKVGQRFDSMFSLLEENEIKYRKYSAYLKPNSKVLKNLKIEIENLKDFLKRPNEIIIQYRELKKVATQDEILLAKVQEQLKLYNLDIARQEEPWQVINGPTVFSSKVLPKTEKYTFLALLLSLIISSFWVYLKEKNNEIVFEIKELKKLLNCKYLDSISKKDEIISMKIIDKTIKNEIGIESYKDYEKVAIIRLSNQINVSKNLINGLKNYFYIDLEETLDTSNFLGLFFVMTPGEITYKEISLINKYIKIYDQKILGWFCIEE